MKFKNGIVLCILAGAVPCTALATNGLSLDAYGPISAGLGGAGMAFDNGMSAAMNNPATLGLMREGNHVEGGVIYLGPSVKATAATLEAESLATTFLMPQLGYGRKSGPLTYGLAIFPSGGMGAEYAADSFAAAGSGELVRSEMAVLRAVVPVAYNITSDLTVGATLDYARGGMDVKLAMTGAQFGDMVAALGGTQRAGTASGTLVSALASNMGTAIEGVNWVRFDFSDNSALTQAASGSGMGGKLGAVYKVMPELTLGATYHLKTKLGSLMAKDATLSMNMTGPMCGGAGVSCSVPITGELAVKDFAWPDMVGFGFAYQPMDGLTLVGDYKLIRWADVMSAFNIGFTPATTQANATANAIVTGGGTALDAQLFQRWNNQNVFALGAMYQLTPAVTLRGGLNLANNPIPDEYVNPIFPAILKNAYHVGAGYAWDASSDFNLAFDYAPGVEATNGSSVKSKLGGIGSQFTYAYHF
ncbi:MAG: hypothetical protein A2X94_02980 [Bdellovibrionales bacterium GWB1_55_8]|nr:MAG: hypothetical protein A2X94_02980 [Bdellovibrionales bacterium GWB1_55_8]